MNCAIAGNYAVPCVFVSGDRAAAEEAQALVPGIEVAIAKEAFTPAVSGLSQVPAPSLSPRRHER